MSFKDLHKLQRRKRLVPTLKTPCIKGKLLLRLWTVVPTIKNS